MANEALQVSRVVHYNSRWYENLDNRKCLQGTRIVKITSDQGLSKRWRKPFPFWRRLFIPLEYINNLQSLRESTMGNNRALKKF